MAAEGVQMHPLCCSAQQTFGQHRHLAVRVHSLHVCHVEGQLAVDEFILDVTLDEELGIDPLTNRRILNPKAQDVETTVVC